MNGDSWMSCYLVAFLSCREFQSMLFFPTIPEIQTLRVLSYTRRHRWFKRGFFGWAGTQLWSLISQWVLLFEVAARFIRLFSYPFLASRDLGSMVSIQYYVVKSNMPEFWQECMLYVRLKGIGYWGPGQLGRTVAPDMRNERHIAER